MKNKLFFAFSLSLLVLTSCAQDAVWKNKKCAVVLTYDDALNIHLDKVVPALDSFGFKGTFYLIGYAPGFRLRVEDWRKASKKGHELANHAMYHPCVGKRPGRDWVQPDYDLSGYTLKRMRDELKMNNTLLEAVDGKTKRTYAYPCGDMKIGDSLYLDKSDFVAARGVVPVMPKINAIDMYNVPAYAISNQTGDELIALVKKAIETNGLLVFLFHGVGGEHSINVSAEAHSKLLHFLKEHENEVWVAPFIDVMEYAKQYNVPKN